MLQGFRYLRGHKVAWGAAIAAFGLVDSLWPALVLATFLVDSNAMVFGMPSGLFPAIGERLGATCAARGWRCSSRRERSRIEVADGGGTAAGAARGPRRRRLDQRVFRSTILLSATTESMCGRLAGIEFAQVASAPTLGNVEAGLVASLTSIRFSVVSGGVITVAGTILISLLMPALVSYDARRKE